MTWATGRGRKPPGLPWIPGRTPSPGIHRLTEAAAVTTGGRISPQDTGIWNDEQVVGWRRAVAFAHARGRPIGVQLARAGCKAATYAPGWAGAPPWRMTAAGRPSPPSAVAFDSDSTPTELTTTGGRFENRIRLVLEVVDAVRDPWPAGKPLLVRMSATDWVEGDWMLAEAAELGGRLREHGVDLVDTCSDGLDPAQQISVGPGFRVPFARDVRTKGGVATGAVGLITEPAQARQILDEGSADVVGPARVALREPAWPLRAAHELGVPRNEAPCAKRYRRGAWY